MAHEDFLTDEYVAGLLAKDAKETNIKYSALGMEAFAQSRPPVNKPKPNTRFLRNIIKDTDSHNAALLAKEAAESKARLKDLAGSKDRERKPDRVGAGDIRKRQLGDIAAILGGSSRRRGTLPDDERSQRRRRNASSDEDEGKDSRSHRRDKSGSRALRARQRTSTDRETRNASKDDGTSEHRRRDREQRRKDRSRSRSPREHRHKKSRHRHRSPTPTRSRSREQIRERLHRHRRSNSMEGPKKESQGSSKKPESKRDYDSDPLDDILGPAPPPAVRSRGRGTVSGASGMDSRFSQNYDPKADVHLDIDEENDWEQALEALRDRQKWKQQGADRLRAAGFTDDEVKKWEKSGSEKREEDVKWGKKGEGREWDRGKVVDDDGLMKFEPSFGRLKDD